jgi:EAL domain-containing protein (putative c-di-GMP-specific phosphodiesterase class I)
MVDPTTFDGFRTHVSEERYSVMEQPILCLKTRKILHQEWLVRFEHDIELLALLRPAEINGAIRDLDLSMLARAVIALNANPDQPGIAVNLSGASFATPKFEHSLMACVKALRAPAHKLVFELTETWDMRDLGHAVSILTKLREMGHPVCLDDVGAGAASIRYLRALPCDWLKIDGEFMTAAFQNQKERGILAALLSLRDVLHVKYIAEGVESDELLRFADTLGFDAAQGYAIDRPSLSVI